MMVIDEVTHVHIAVLSCTSWTHALPATVPQADACITDLKHRKSVQDLLTRYLSPTFRKFDAEAEAQEAAIAEWALKPTRKWIYRNQRQTDRKSTRLNSSH